MFDHIRTGLESDLQQCIQQQSQSQQAATNAQSQIVAAQGALDAANRALTAAQQAVAGAQGSLNAANSNRQAKQAALATAQAAVTAWMEQEPDPFLGFLRPRVPPDGGGGGGRPNPAHITWLRQLNILKAAVVAAQKVLDSAVAVVASATAALNNANAQRDARRWDVAARTNDVAQRRAMAAMATSAEIAAAAAVAAVRAKMAALDARAAALVAEPMNRPSITAMADEEQAEVNRLRTLRAKTRADRFAASRQRLAILNAHDALIESLTPQAASIHGWSDSAYPDPPGVATAIDALVIEARRQRGATPRVDDLAGLANQAQRVLARFQTTVDSVIRDCAAKNKALQDAIDTVRKVNLDSP